MALREYEKEKGVIENACGCRNENFILKAVNNHKLQTIEDKKAKRPEIVCMNKTKHFPKKILLLFPIPKTKEAILTTGRSCNLGHL